MTAGALSMAAAYVIGRLRMPRWTYWALSIAFLASWILTVVLLRNVDSPWPNAISLGLATVAGATAGIGFHGARSAQARSNT